MGRHGGAGRKARTEIKRRFPSGPLRDSIKPGGGGPPLYSLLLGELGECVGAVRRTPKTRKSLPVGGCYMLDTHLCVWEGGFYC